jgi:hypothetical protein
MTASELHNLTKDLFAKHPSAKPEFLNMQYFDGQSCDNEIKAAALIIQGHLFAWMSAHQGAHFFCKQAEDVFVVDRVAHHTLIRALVAACLQVPQ